MKNRLRMYQDKEQTVTMTRAEYKALIMNFGRINRELDEVRDNNIWLIRELAELREKGVSK
jgi:hypothetical protein